MPGRGHRGVTAARLVFFGGFVMMPIGLQDGRSALHRRFGTRRLRPQDLPRAGQKSLELRCRDEPRLDGYAKLATPPFGRCAIAPERRGLQRHRICAG
jgi:hypothetical protein